jgi:hypothetical protein
MKKTLMIIFMIMSSNIQAFDNIEKYETKINEILSKVELKKDKEFEEKNILNIFDKINKNKSYTEYKKELLKANAILFYQSIYMGESEQSLLLIARKSFPVSICTAFHFQNNTSNVLNSMLSDILNTDFKIKKYSESAKFLYSEPLMKKLKLFMPTNKKEIESNCIQGKTFPLI